MFHNGLPCARVVGQQEAQAGTLQQHIVDSLDLVGEGFNLGNGNGIEGVKLVGKTDADGLKAAEKGFAVPREIAKGTGNFFKGG